MTEKQTSEHHHTDLDAAPGEVVLTRARVLREESRPVAVLRSTFSRRAVAALPELLSPPSTDRFWCEVYQERTGRRVSWPGEMILARHTTKEELEALELPPVENAPVLVRRIVRSDEAGPLEVVETISTPGQWDLDTRLGGSSG